MKYTILGDSDCPIVQATLEKGETIKIERGSMVYLSNVSIEGKMNSQKKGIGGVLGAIGRSMTSGESMFITFATGQTNQSVLGIAPPIPGKIHCLHVDPYQQYRLNTGAFLACDETVDYVMKKQDIGKALFGGTGGLFVMETQGQGDILVSAFGDLMKIEVTPDHPITIDNEHVVAWDSSLEYNIKVASGTFGFTTGEGLVNEFYGSGTVLIQTRNVHNLADAVRPFLPTSSSN
ncbi:TIGR00266 family protein [uncultured Faecalicoccus sp.]|uniref:TIGR00266 family protein n=1 Tax=uncultured Faecalicoccus sp. TaxID=1971760 RepID=UPI00260E2B42|nr:TIGR00266 family protein [uncultured Faecalicoccus sp.]